MRKVCALRLKKLAVDPLTGRILLRKNIKPRKGTSFQIEIFRKFTNNRTFVLIPKIILGQQKNSRKQRRNAACGRRSPKNRQQKTTQLGGIFSADKFIVGDSAATVNSLPISCIFHPQFTLVTHYIGNFLRSNHRNLENDRNTK